MTYDDGIPEEIGTIEPVEPVELVEPVEPVEEVKPARYWCVMHDAAVAQYFDPETTKGKLLGHEPELCQANRHSQRIRECFFSRLPLDETTQEIMRQQVAAENERR